MRRDGGRWVEVTPTWYPHEYGGLAHVRDQLPDVEPFRAWANFEVVVGGRPHEVDLLVLAPAGFFLVELKGWSGRIHGTEHLWRIGKSRQRSPLIAANDKARVLGSVLQRYAQKRGGSMLRVPRVEAAVFLYDPGTRFEVPQRDGVFGQEALESDTGLPGVVSGLLCRTPASSETTVDAALAVELTALLKDSDMMHRQHVRVGPYVLDDEVRLVEGPGWCEYLAVHSDHPDDQARVRVYLANRTTSQEERKRLERAAKREHRLERKLSYPGIVRPEFNQGTPMGPAIVYPYDRAAQHLDNVLADGVDNLPLGTRLEIFRGIVEAVKHAHDLQVTHRALTPRSVLVTIPDVGAPAVQVADWQAAAWAAGTTARRDSLLAGTRDVSPLLGKDAYLYLAPEAGLTPGFDGVSADVFSVGAIAYALLGGQFSAEDRSRYREMLARDSGLRLGDTGLPSELVELIRTATDGAVPTRLSTMDEFLEPLAKAQAAVAPVVTGDVDPLRATQGALLAGRWQVVRPLGSGTTGTALLVEDATVDGRQYVLKVGNSESGAQRLHSEAETLSRLDSPLVARLFTGPFTIHGRTAIVIEYAGDIALASELRRGRLTTEKLSRLGVDLLETVGHLTSRDVLHRDIKPSNLAIRGATKHDRERLVLFDFSHSAEPVTDLETGTPPYLDPFLGAPQRPEYDRAAELYATAVTLFEMSTGHTPTYGDGRSHAAVVDAEVTIKPYMFDSSVAESLTAFFRRALHRQQAHRFPDSATMRRAWIEATTPQPTDRTRPDHSSGEPKVTALPATQRTRRRRLRLAAAVLAVLAVLSIAWQPMRNAILGDSEEPSAGNSDRSVLGVPRAPSDLAATFEIREFAESWDRYPSWHRCRSTWFGENRVDGTFPAHDASPELPLLNISCDNGGSLTVMFASFPADSYGKALRAYTDATPPKDPVNSEATPPSGVHVFQWSDTHRALVWTDSEDHLIGILTTGSSHTDLVELWNRYHN